MAPKVAAKAKAKAKVKAKAKAQPLPPAEAPPPPPAEAPPPAPESDRDFATRSGRLDWYVQNIRDGTEDMILSLQVALQNWDEACDEILSNYPKEWERPSKAVRDQRAKALEEAEEFSD